MNMEKTNISDPSLLDLDPKPSVASVDLSYLSLQKAVPIVMNIINDDGYVMALVKPIYETENMEIRRTGKINVKHELSEILSGLIIFFSNNNLSVADVTWSSILGNKDTIEFFLLITKRNGSALKNPSDKINHCVEVGCSLLEEG